MVGLVRSSVVGTQLTNLLVGECFSVVFCSCRRKSEGEVFSLGELFFHCIIKSLKFIFEVSTRTSSSCCFPNGITSMRCFSFVETGYGGDSWSNAALVPLTDGCLSRFILGGSGGGSVSVLGAGLGGGGGLLCVGKF